MKKLSALICLLTLLLACENPSPSNAPANQLNATEPTFIPVHTLRGMYKIDAQGTFFYDCTANETYRVGARPAGLDSMYRALCQPPSYPGEPVFAVLQGKIAKPARGESVLAITNIDTLTVRTMHNSCQAYDFWCIGTEPFWGLVISESEGTIVLKMIAEEQAKVFPWKKPKQVRDTLIYESTDPAGGDKIKVLVSKTPCSDGMSERQYSHSVEIQIGPQILLGCAVE